MCYLPESKNTVNAWHVTLPFVSTPHHCLVAITPESNQVFNLDWVGYRGLVTHLARVGWSWIELAWIWSSSNFRPTRAKFSPVWPLRPTSANSCQGVRFGIVWWLHGRSQKIGWFCCELARLGSHPQMQVLICNLARVGLSWEYRLAGANAKINSYFVCLENPLTWCVHNKMKNGFSRLVRTVWYI